jgi:hypothetical protein
MPRNIANRSHPTPNPDRPHASGPAEEKIGDATNSRRPSPGAHRPPAQESSPGDAADDEPPYDSCFDDLNMILSQSIQQPDPDPNLESSGPSVRLAGEEVAVLLTRERGKAPRTSEIFRAVVAASSPVERSDQPGSPDHRPGPSPIVDETAAEPDPEAEPPIADLVVLDRSPRVEALTSEETSEEEGSDFEASIPWGHVLLMSYASAITLALIWLLWTGRWSRVPTSEPPSPSQPVVGPSSRVAEPANAAPPIPAENRARIGQTIRLGDLEVTPMTVISAPVELVRSIEPDDRRLEADCLVLRLRVRNISRDHAFAPLGPELTRDRGLRPYDPYIEASEGSSIRLFPLAADSEWAIVGQGLGSIKPGDTLVTFVAAEPGSAHHVASELTWRVRFRTGVYRTDMLAVPFSRDEIRPAESTTRDIEVESP